ncbi:Protein kinase-like domain protein [Drechmeria coniospora]|uniref:Protein kinase-like domain protein n=1 Tax=Drechmeria coniospora TaxID=98403 RepID=A0A151GGU1_DRECN|nr:Protein kinase-like domain protein [Drechmeria coniospora]KYK56286.1 Protein kinase-like domain protein [Drechmeria coniospora]
MLGDVMSWVTWFAPAAVAAPGIAPAGAASRQAWTRVHLAFTSSHTLCFFPAARSPMPRRRPTMQGLVILDDAPPPKWPAPRSSAPPRREQPTLGPLKLRFVPSPPTTETVRFRFRTRFVHATASQVDGVHRNVIRLRVHPSAADRLVQIIYTLLPSPWLARCKASFPEWSLPSCLVVKKHKDGWDEEFEAEKATYAKLASLQGIVIPECYGEIRYCGARALLLSDIGGACLATPAGALLDEATFCRIMHDALTTLTRFGVLQEDRKLDNFHLVGDAVMVVDLESMSEGLSDEEFASDVASTVKWLARFYKTNQHCFLEDGFIAVDE